MGISMRPETTLRLDRDASLSHALSGQVRLPMSLGTAWAHGAGAWLEREGRPRASASSWDAARSQWVIAAAPSSEEAAGA